MRGLSALKSGMISQLIRRLSKFAYVGDIQDSDGHQNTKMTMMYHQCGSISPDDVITVPP